ncbi:DNA starvation/stationary phase protection protein [Paenalcaligenes niemegkensis]|uniref:Dps family protein n=1 Tax=Paenalcaligenes niemegkensis TaxID=2895469 RepID=UPI001EE919F6|nr:Dps family protein [Paenalcaligenes niemegkensis]MCQ9616338.1 DNA starvation/stationary phase protection protein [Paenalcaligenes niemegkensis]
MAKATKAVRKSSKKATKKVAVRTTGILAVNIGISETDREKIAQELSKVLADSYTVYLMTHNFHWNVTGPMFNTLHVMFMEQYTETWQALDLIAERIRALGHYAPGTYAQFATLSSISEPTDIPEAPDMIEMLLRANEGLARTARAAFDCADGADDQPTADLLTQRLDVHEKNAWMLRSLLQ